MKFTTVTRTGIKHKFVNAMIHFLRKTKPMFAIKAFKNIEVKSDFNRKNKFHIPLNLILILMKTLFFVLIISAFFYSCGSSDQEDKSKYASNPCNDSLFIALKQKSIDSLTERQYQYVRDKEKDCNEYTAFQKKQKTYEKDVSSSSNMRTVWIVLAIVSIVSTIAALIIILPKH